MNSKIAKKCQKKNQNTTGLNVIEFTYTTNLCNTNLDFKKLHIPRKSL